MFDNQHNLYDDYETYHEEIVDELKQVTSENSRNVYLIIAAVAVVIIAAGACFIYL